MKTITTASKKALALFMSLLMLCSGFAMTASAAVTVDQPVLSLDASAKTITVTNTQADITYTISPEAPSGKDSEGKVFFYNLQSGTTYTVKPSLVIEGSDPVYGPTASATLLKSQAAPAAPIPTLISSTTITVASVSGCEYKIETESGALISDWSNSATFTGLAAATRYKVSIRKAAVANEYYASAAATIIVKTLLAGDTSAVATPTLKNKTMNTIEVNAAAGFQYSIDGGKNWSSTGSFAGLTANTVYNIIARKAFDPSMQEAGAVSSSLVVRTNSRVSYVASVSKCTFKAEDGKRYANEAVKITVTEDSPANASDIQYGDTAYFPTSFTAAGQTNLRFSASGKSYTGTFVPGDANANKTITVTVTFTESRYDGSNWVATGKSVPVNYDVEIGAVNNTLTKVKEFFETIFNFFLNTLPGLIAKAMSSDALANFFKMIGNLIGSKA